MNEKLKKAFDQVQAEDDLKDRTKEYLTQKTRGYTKRRFMQGQRLLSAAACLLLLVIGGRWLYFIPTAKISIDINPSIELGINRFDRVVSVGGRNEDGKELAASLDIRFADYAEAVTQIMENEQIAALLSGDEVMTIAVVETGRAQSSRILSGIESCTEGRRNTYCCSADSKEAEQAHACGLSYGKYKAFLELQELNPKITPDEVQDMTMREIQDLIDELSAGEKKETHSKERRHRHCEE